MNFIQTAKTNIEDNGGDWTDFFVTYKDHIEVQANGGTLVPRELGEFNQGLADAMPDASPAVIAATQAQVSTEVDSVDVSVNVDALQAEIDAAEAVNDTQQTQINQNISDIESIETVNDDQGTSILANTESITDNATADAASDAAQQAEDDQQQLEIDENLVRANKIIFQVSGQWLLDPNEQNGWGVIGVYDNTNSQDLGNVGAEINRLAGGISFPFDVRIDRLQLWHQNSNNSAQAWGWVMTRQQKVAGSNTRTNTVVFDEVADNAGVAPRNYLSTANQLTDIDTSELPNNVLPAGHILNLAIAAPTAVTTNYYARVMSGFLELTRVNN